MKTPVRGDSDCPSGGWHLWRFTVTGKPAECVNCGAAMSDERDLDWSREPTPPKESALDWYAEQAEALKRYTEHNPPLIDGIAAVVAALALDGGQRAKKK